MIRSIAEVVGFSKTIPPLRMRGERGKVVIL
jgi:hypothetical protein